ncbi:trypsin, alkaline C-like [Manduca sexta]|uniref:trypsin, alkaline C-like n=1 Tax=Manduca sexta TaxID=7130 RepID=UPI0018905ABC|nr:trypsin, alkaline C-like [Manduca sexta]
MKVVFLLALLGTALAAPKSVSRIVGGSPTTIYEYPYLSNMEFHLLGIIWFQFCGGSLITSSVVLSAAHCYAGDHPSQWRVRLGSTFVNTGGSLIGVSELLIHPKYSGATLDADVAIVRLSRPAVFSDGVRSARIAGPNYNLPDGTPVNAAGWGALSVS